MCVRPPPPPPAALQTFAGFLEDGTGGESGGSLLARFIVMLLGSVGTGLLVGVIATFVFRYVHIGPDRDRGLIALHEWLGAVFGCHCRVRNAGRGAAGSGASPHTPLAGMGGYNSLESENAVPFSRAGAESEAAHDGDEAGSTSLVPTPPTAASGTGATAGSSAAAAGSDDAASALAAKNILAPYASVNAVRAGAGAAGSRVGLDGFGAHGGAGVVRGEVKPDSSVFTQVKNEREKGEGLASERDAVTGPRLTRWVTNCLMPRCFNPPPFCMHPPHTARRSRL